MKFVSWGTTKVFIALTFTLISLSIFFPHENDYFNKPLTLCSTLVTIQYYFVWYLLSIEPCQRLEPACLPAVLNLANEIAFTKIRLPACLVYYVLLVSCTFLLNIKFLSKKFCFSSSLKFGPERR